jgi:hypothetical protein
MSKMLYRGIASALLSVAAIAAIVYFVRPSSMPMTTTSAALYDDIVIFVERIIYNKWIEYNRYCVNGGCATIVSETHVSRDSETKKYVYLGDKLYIPRRDKNYVLFRDFAKLCLRRVEGDRYEIYSR